MIYASFSHNARLFTVAIHQYDPDGDTVEIRVESCRDRDAGVDYCPGRWAWVPRRDVFPLDSLKRHGKGLRLSGDVKYPQVTAWRDRLPHELPRIK